MKIDMRAAPASSDELKKVMTVMSDIAEVFMAQNIGADIQTSALAGMLAMIGNSSVPPEDQERWLAVFLDAVRINIKATASIVETKRSSASAAAYLAQLKAARRE